MDRTTPEEFLQKTNKEYKKVLLAQASDTQYGNWKRLRSGVLAVDLVLGGGWPFGTISLVFGPEHSGKTFLATQTMKQARLTCKHCRERDCACFEPCNVLFIDMEGKFDFRWAARQGLSPTEFYHARLEYAEQMVDVVTEAVADNAFDLVIVDSIAASTPIEELEKSAEDNCVGLLARQMNKGFRKWIGGLIKTENPPHLMFLNQNRLKVGVLYGDPSTLPGGMGQLFAAPIHVKCKTPKFTSKGNFTSHVELRGSTPKNGTFIPRLDFTCTQGLRESESLCVGEVDNAAQVVRFAKLFNLLVQDKGWHVRQGDIVYVSGKKQDEIISVLRTDPELLEACYSMILEVGCESLYGGSTEIAEVSQESSESSESSEPADDWSEEQEI